MCAAKHGVRVSGGKPCRRCASLLLILFPTPSRSPAPVYYLRCVGVAPMPVEWHREIESGARCRCLMRCPRVRLPMSYRRCGPFTPRSYEVSWYSASQLQELALQKECSVTMLVPMPDAGGAACRLRPSRPPPFLDLSAIAGQHWICESHSREVIELAAS